MLSFLVGGNHAMKERLSVTVDSDLVVKINELSAQEKIPRSRIIVEALRLWEERRMENLMRRGYLESADEDLTLAEFDLEAGNEVME
jgi:metal-responsive CopG/Arc/MetJ family transcriptional regulator